MKDFSVPLIGQNALGVSKVQNFPDSFVHGHVAFWYISGEMSENRLGETVVQADSFST